MMSTYPPGAHSWWWPLRIVRVRWRLFFAALVALLVFALLPSDWRLINRILRGWDVGVVTYLMLAVGLAMVTDANHIRPRSPLYDEGRVAVPVLTATAALASIGAIFDQLTTAPAGHNLLNLVFAVVTILLSWSVIQVIFAFHYAHEYCAEHRGQVRGLGFPGDDAPSACSKLSRKFNRQFGRLMNADQAAERLSCLRLFTGPGKARSAFMIKSVSCRRMNQSNTRNRMAPSKSSARPTGRVKVSILLPK
jgi:uncharacterized membrane protein